jgi:hypothetical protein
MGPPGLSAQEASNSVIEEIMRNAALRGKPVQFTDASSPLRAITLRSILGMP